MHSVVFRAKGPKFLSPAHRAGYAVSAVLRPNAGAISSAFLVLTMVALQATRVNPTRTQDVARRLAVPWA
jgi:hypothetical protein